MVLVLQARNIQLSPFQRMMHTTGKYLQCILHQNKPQIIFGENPRAKYYSAINFNLDRSIIVTILGVALYCKQDMVEPLSTTYFTGKGTIYVCRCFSLLINFVYYAVDLLHVCIQMTY